MAQSIINLPKPLLDTPAFFAVKPNKVPIVKDWGNPKNQKSYKDIDGLMGFDITKAGILVFDFDNVLNPDGSWRSDKAKATFYRIMQLNPYAEISISVKGIHVVVKPTVGKFDKITNSSENVLYFGDDHKAKDCPKLEIFYGSKARYILFTGNVFHCKPNTPIPEGELVDLLVEKIIDEIHQANKKPMRDPALVYDSRVDSHYSDKNPADNLPAMHMKSHNSTNNLNDDYDFQIAAIRAALKFIPANLPYNDWITILMAAHSFDSGSQMMSIMDDWSKTAPEKYKEGNVEYNWNKSFHSSDGITIATLFKFAKDYGFDQKAFHKEYYKDSKPKSKKKYSTQEKSSENSSVEDTITNIINNLQRDKKGEKILASTYNFKLILKNDPLIKDCIGYDLFNQQPTRLKKFSWTKTNLKTDTWRDVDDAGIQDYIALTYGIRNQAVFNTTFLVFLHENSFHPVRDYFNSLPEWDGCPRAETLFIDGLDIPDTEYVRQVSKKWLLAAVARIFSPGCKWDYVLTIKSPQGAGKSTIFNRLGGDWFTDSIGSLDGKDALEQLQGNWIVELAELQATKKSENEQIKSFISRKIDKFRKPYGRNVESYPRQCVFCGSTNSEEFLKDHTGGRRFLLLISNATADTFEQRMNGLTKDYVDKVWAEVFHWFKELFEKDEDDNYIVDPNKLDIPQNIKQEANELQSKYTEGSELEATVTSFLEKKIPRDNYWKIMTKKERRLWMNGEMTSIDSERVNEPGSYTALEAEESRHKVCAAEIVYEAMNIDNPGEPRNRLLIRQINEILSRLPDWQRAQVKFGVRFGDYGQQKISFMKKLTT